MTRPEHTPNPIAASRSPSGARSRRPALAMAMAVLVALLLVACRSAEPPVALAPPDQAAAEAELVPRFALAHARWLAPDPALAEVLDAPAERLGAALDPPVSIAVAVNAAPEADAGCLAGGRVWLSEGLLAELSSPTQLAAALAFGVAQCPEASEQWRARAGLALGADRPDSLLAARFRDFRLPANAALYARLTARGCGRRTCDRRVVQLLERIDVAPSAWVELQAHLAAVRPEALLLERSGYAGDAEAALAGPETAALAGVLAEFHARRDGLRELAASRLSLAGGDLLEAYRAGLRARRQLAPNWRLRLHQAELDLENNHIEYAERILRDIERDGVEIPHADYWWGWVHLGLRQRAPAAARFVASLEVLPRASAHYRLAEAQRRLGRPEAAIANYRRVLAAGPLHRQHRRAELRLAELGVGSPSAAEDE